MGEEGVLLALSAMLQKWACRTTSKSVLSRTETVNPGVSGQTLGKPLWHCNSWQHCSLSHVLLTELESRVLEGT